MKAKPDEASSKTRRKMLYVYDFRGTLYINAPVISLDLLNIYAGIVPE
jgi:hypothetical protein